MLRALRVLGWIFIPYVMIFVQWHKLQHSRMKTGTIVWSVVLAISTIGTINRVMYQSPESQPMASASVQGTNTEVGTPNGTTTTAPKPKPKPTKQDSLKVEADKLMQQINSDPLLGQAHEVGNLNVTVLSVNQYKTVGTGPLATSANGMYWGIYLTVRNDGTQSQMINESMFDLYGPTLQNKFSTFSPDTSADILANGSSNFLVSELNPGVSETGYIVFDMPSNIAAAYMAGFQLQVTNGSGLFGAGKTQNFALIAKKISPKK